MFSVTQEKLNIIKRDTSCPAAAKIRRQISARPRTSKYINLYLDMFVRHCKPEKTTGVHQRKVCNMKFLLHPILIFTDRVRSMTGRLCFDTCLSIHPSICLSTPMGYSSQIQGGTPARSSLGGTPAGGVPKVGYPHQPGWGVSQWGGGTQARSRGVP